MMRLRARERTRRPLTVLLFAGCLLALGTAGCDFGTDIETVTYFEELLFRFEFSADDAVVGQPLTVRAGREEDMRARLSARGFSPDAVRSARVTEGRAVVEVLFPLQEPISFLDSLALQLVSPTAGTREAAVQTEFPGGPLDDSVTLVPVEGADLSLFVADTALTAELVLTPGRLTAGADYELAAQFRLEIEVSAF